MKFKELFDKEFLFESMKDDKTITKIFYKFDINIKKIEEAETSKSEQPTNSAPEQSVNPAPAPEQTIPPVDNTAPIPNTALNTPVPPVDNTASEQLPDVSNIPLASVVTEDDDEKISINDDDNIVRKLEGEVTITREDIDSIQTIEDILTKLTESKVDGVSVLDEFTADILQVIIDPATQQQLKDKIGKESTIFAEILYGKKRENSVGLRIIKRKNSDLLTTSMMIDNKVINAQYKKETLDKRITDYRNDEFEEEK